MGYDIDAIISIGYIYS